MALNFSDSSNLEELALKGLRTRIDNPRNNLYTFCFTDYRSMMTEKTVAWQETKSQSERFRYMLENEIACDVCFEICSPEGSVTLVRAHKVFLVAASPVFEAMFCGRMVEARSDSGSIKIPDIDARTFKEMLRLHCH